jgi:hypothetical protein
MQSEKLIHAPSEKGHTYLLIVYALAILCFSQTALAQSGRRPDKSVPSPPPPVTAGPAITPQTDKPPVQISSVLVVGYIVHNYSYFQSDYLEAAIKEFMDRIKLRPRPVVQITKGGNMTFNEAKERAKKETDTYVLWIEFAVKDDDYGNMFLDYVVYAVLTPKTASRLTSDRFNPDHTFVLNRGGVMRLPSTRSRASGLSQMREGAREVAERLIHGGWL